MRRIMLSVSVLMLCMVSIGHAQETGTIRYEIWDGIGGTGIADLMGNANYPDNPTSGDLLTLFETPTNRADNFGGRVYGWLHPEIDGDYTFWIAADDNAELWLSTTDSADDAVLIAFEDGWAGARNWAEGNEQSAPVSLVGGQKYYIEGLYKEGGGGDNLAVGWATEPNMALIEVIDGKYLSPAPMQVALLKARTVGPADGAVDLDPSVTLEWTPGPTAIMTQVYLSTDETIDADDMIGQTQDSSMVVDLELGTTYYWRVDAVSMDGAYEGVAQAFSVISDQAHFESPADGAIMQAIDSQLSWTTGIGALVHNVYVSTDKALVDARDPSISSQYYATNTFDLGVLEYDATYYWAIDEFSGLATVAGPTWSFSTLYSIPVTDPNMVGWWKLDDVESGIIMDMSGHGNVGTVMGDPEIVTVDGVIAMDFDGAGDFIYTGKSASDLGIGGNHARSVSSWIYTRSFGNGGIYDMGHRSGGQDFSLRTLDGNVDSWRVQYWGGANDFDFSYDTNDVWVHVAQVHDEVGTKIYMNGELIVDYAVTLDTPDNNPFQIACYGWQNDYFDGMIRDVRLYDKALTEADVAALSLEISDITGPGAVVLGVPNEVRDGSITGWPDGEHPALALDDNTGTKFLHFAGEVAPTGLQIAPTVDSTVVTGLSLTTANDAVERDPITYEVYGSNESIDGPYELIAAGDIVDFFQADAWPRFTKNATPIIFENTVAYAYYQVMFPTVRDAAGANSMQIAEVELLGKAPVIGEGLVAYYALDGDANDGSGNGNDGTVNNPNGGLGLDGSVWVDDPERGTVISFNGTADGAYVRAGDIPQMTLTNDFTWSFWAKQDASNTTPNNIVLGNRKDENAVDFVPRQFIKFTPTKFEWHMNGNGDDNLDYDDIPADVWIHHAVVKTGDQLTYYRNGIEASSGAFTQPADFPQPLFLGGDNEAAEGENWAGFLSDVSIYDRALSSSEIRYNAGS